ncbi:hypothetical protein FHX82_003366 [Amycolatopsis bartoniae]|nr:hypothetical protein [Amycolatopsis bartoniae]
MRGPAGQGGEPDSLGVTARGLVAEVGTVVLELAQ